MRLLRPGKAIIIAVLYWLVPPHQAYQGKELIKGVCPQDLSEAIRGHLFRLNTFGDNHPLLLQVPNVVEANINMLGTLGPVARRQCHGALVIHIEGNRL